MPILIQGLQPKNLTRRTLFWKGTAGLRFSVRKEIQERHGVVATAGMGEELGTPQPVTIHKNIWVLEVGWPDGRVSRGGEIAEVAYLEIVRLLEEAGVDVREEPSECPS